MQLASNLIDLREHRRCAKMIMTRLVLLIIKQAIFFGTIGMLGTATYELAHHAADSWTKGPMSISRLNNALFEQK